MSKQSFGELPLWYRQLEDLFTNFPVFSLMYNRAWGYAEIWANGSRIARWCGTREAIYREGDFFSLDVRGLVDYIYQRIGKEAPTIDWGKKKKGRSKKMKTNRILTPLELATERMGWK